MGPHVNHTPAEQPVSLEPAYPLARAGIS